MILMVDDEKRWVDGYKEALDLSGYTCELIDNVDDLAMWLDDPDKLAQIDLVILDIMMAPRKRYKHEDTQDGMNTGNFVLNELRQLRPSIPIIVLTNKEAEINGGKMAQLCDHYLLKENVTTNALTSLVAEILKGVTS